MSALPRLLLAILVLLASPAVHAECVTGQKLRLLHFNDFHGQLEPYAEPGGSDRVAGIARLAAAVAGARAEDPTRPVLLLFAGDLLQGTVTSSLFFGIPDVALFGKLGVDAAAMGNHEIDYGQDVFRRLAGRADFPFLSANVASQPDPLPAKAYTVLAKPGAPRVAVLGLTTGELTTATHPKNVYGISVEHPVAAARRLLPELRGQSDMVVVLSHMGIADDRNLARALPELDLIVGGHNHNVYREPELEGGVAIVQAGERGRWLGRLDLDCRDGRMVRTGYRLLDLNGQAAADPAIANEVGRIVAEAERELTQVVGTSPVELDARREVLRRGEGVFGDFVADLAREISAADVALFNGGGFRASIPAGPVTLKHIYQSFPFRNELVVGRLTGARLLAALERAAAMDPAENPGGFLQVSGLRFRIEAGRVTAAEVAGKAVDPAASYTVVLPDFLAEGGDGYAMLKEMDAKVMSGRLISDMVIEAFRSGRPVPASPDGRISRLP
jgi:2',3'-cyclic-nucleotide 2'-phosphodiesterase (5'-nucleotidase family)